MLANGFPISIMANFDRSSQALLQGQISWARKLPGHHSVLLGVKEPPESPLFPLMQGGKDYLDTL
jgi:hypothetical protein